MSNKICSLTRAIIIKQDHILLCKTKIVGANNFYFLPGGHIELNETTEQALYRELFEEIGDYKFTIKYLGCIEHIFPNARISLCHYHEYNFIYLVEANDFKMNKDIMSLENGQDLEWVKLVDLADQNLQPTALYEIIKNLQQNTLQVGFFITVKTN